MTDAYVIAVMLTVRFGPCSLVRSPSGLRLSRLWSGICQSASKIFSTSFDRVNLSVIMRLPLKALRLLLGPLYQWRAELFSFSACAKTLRLRAQPIVLGKRCDVVSPKTVRFHRTQALGKHRLLIRCRSCIRSQPKQLC